MEARSMEVPHVGHWQEAGCFTESPVVSVISRRILFSAFRCCFFSNRLLCLLALFERFDVLCTMVHAPKQRGRPRGRSSGLYNGWHCLLPKFPNHLCVFCSCWVDGPAQWLE